ncbi:MAG: cyclic nucleotide-binding domain-containing protein [Candidatus Limnocylindrales bacterium]
MAATNPDDAVLSGWLATMPREARSKILAIATPTSFPGGTEIMREGDRVAWFGVVASGRIALQLGVSGRGQVTLETAEVGEVFGLSALVPPHRATTTVTAVGDVHALAVDASAIRSLFEQDCEFAASVYFAVARALLGRLDAAHEALIDLSGGASSPVP